MAKKLKKYQFPTKDKSNEVKMNPSMQVVPGSVKPVTSAQRDSIVNSWKNIAASKFDSLKKERDDFIKKNYPVKKERKGGSVKSKPKKK